MIEYMIKGQAKNGVFSEPTSEHTSPPFSTLGLDFVALNFTDTAVFGLPREKI